MDWLTTIPQEIVSTLLDMAPYLLFGFVVAGILSVFISKEQVERHLGGKGLWPVIKASLVGVPLPLCSCGVIPVTASLRKHGASRGAAVSFLLSTPQTGVDSIAVTYSLLGPVFAIFRPVAAFVSGVLGGLAVNVFDKRDDLHQADKCEDECCAPTNEGGRFIRAIRYAFVVLPRDLAKPLIAGLVVAGLIEVAIPDNFFNQYMGHGIGAMIVMMLVGIPMYVCATASVPIALAMMLKGISPGAALVFLMTGPATNAASIAMVWKMFGRRTAIIYLLVVSGTALASGLALDAVFAAIKVNSVQGSHEMLPYSVNVFSALFLLIVLAAAVLGRGGHAHKLAHGLKLAITGMTCSHCTGSVQAAIAGVPGVTAANVSLDDATAEVDGEGYDRDALIKAIEDAGFGVRIQGTGIKHEK